MGYVFLVYLTWFLIFLKIGVEIQFSWLLVFAPIISVLGFWLIILSMIWYNNYNCSKR